MSVFANYAHYYDLLYSDKNYEREVQFIHQLIKAYRPDSASILELGCGTGKHAILFAKQGYTTHGVDLSSEMLQNAQNQRLQMPLDLASRLTFSCGDIRKVRLNQKFDVILSLFHVISYQTTNEDVKAAFDTVKKHLNPGGVFIFDVWYGPAVLTERPSIRIKRLENTNLIFTRIAEPIIHPNENLVDVKYQFFIQDKNSNAIQEFRETHHLRYFFKPEMDLLLNPSGLKIVDCREWMTELEPGFNTWGVYFVLQT